ncbi:MAG TPA: hypothetical protein PLT50_01515 [bacterium]|nr:hypothetical protein [bacterium]
MITGGIGGGNTLTGLNFEEETSLMSIFSKLKDYSVSKADIGQEILYKKETVAYSYRKHDLYRFLEYKGVNWREILSKKLLPDDALYIIANNTLFIIEMKSQMVVGSVDEKLQTCDFKKKQYKRLMAPLNIDVEYIYILNEWFRKPEYKDVLDYIISVDCQYYFNYIPLKKLGLPVPEDSE